MKRIGFSAKQIQTAFSTSRANLDRILERNATDLAPLDPVFDLIGHVLAPIMHSYTGPIACVAASATTSAMVPQMIDSHDQDRRMQDLLCAMDTCVMM